MVRVVLVSIHDGVEFEDYRSVCQELPIDRITPKLGIVVEHYREHRTGHYCRVGRLSLCSKGPDKLTSHSLGLPVHKHCRSVDVVDRDGFARTHRIEPEALRYVIDGVIALLRRYRD